MNFNRSIFENRKRRKSPFLVAHRGVCGANIPCNSIAAYQIALEQGADVVEIDVSKSKDGKFYVFHPGMEHIFLRSDKQIKDMDSSEVENLFLVNQDGVKTSYRVPKLSEVFALLKDKVYINVDKYWTDVKGINEEIYKAGVEKQVIVKSYVDKNNIDEIKNNTGDLMFIPLVWNKDNITNELMNSGINLIGVEVLFDKEDDPCINDEYISNLHKNRLLLWVNSIIYDENAVISAHHTDDLALTQDKDNGWGWIIDKGADFIQTDWLLMLKKYINSRK